MKKKNNHSNNQRKLYLAYGSNLSRMQMAHRCPEAVIEGFAYIEDYELLFKGSRTGCYATIEPKKGSKVPVLVWSISREDEANLDVYEGVAGGFYYKKNLTIDMKIFGTGIPPASAGKHEAMVYIMDERRMFGVPSYMYYDTLRCGYEDFGFNLDILERGLLESCKRMFDIKSSVELK